MEIVKNVGYGFLASFFFMPIQIVLGALAFILFLAAISVEEDRQRQMMEVELPKFKVENMASCHAIDSKKETVTFECTRKD